MKVLITLIALASFNIFSADHWFDTPEYRRQCLRTLEVIDECTPQSKKRPLLNNRDYLLKYKCEVGAASNPVTLPIAIMFSSNSALDYFAPYEDLKMPYMACEKFHRLVHTDMTLKEIKETILRDLAYEWKQELPTIKFLFK